MNDLNAMSMNSADSPNSTSVKSLSSPWMVYEVWSGLEIGA